MEIRVLNYFLTVVKEGSITKAADVLHMTQPTLSRQLSAMEEELGVKLFKRGSRKITLTEQGIQLKKRAEEILQLVEKTKEEVSLFDEQQIRHLMIGCSVQFNPEQAGRMINKLMDNYPYTSIEMIEECDEVLAEKIEAGILDGAFLQERINGAKYDSIEIYRHNPAAWVNKGHPLADSKKTSLEELSAYPLIVPSLKEGSSWAKHFKGKGNRPRGLLVASHSLAREVLARNKKAVMVWPSWHTVSSSPSELEELSLNGSPESCGYFCWNKDNSNRINLFLKNFEQ